MKRNQNQSEAIILELRTIGERFNIGVFESAIEFCKLHEIDMEDFIDCLDGHAIELLKKNAIENRMVRRKYTGIIHELPLSED